jgi:DNA-binding CsgD family transcriptional regulator
MTALGRIVEAVRAGESRVLVIRGEPGVGKTALLDYVAEQATGCRVVRALGVQSEMELAFAGLHQLCTPMLSRLDRLPAPQREALQTALGLSAGPAPDRFLVGLAVLSLLAETAEERPLMCLVDDQQWLDRASAQSLGFVARRLAAEPVGLIFSARDPGDELAGLPELNVEGLQESDAQALLDAVLAGPLDARVRDQIVAETRGNPLALLELPRGLTSAQLAGGFGLAGARPLSGRIEERFLRQIQALPPETQRLLQLAAADPSGDMSLVWRAAGRLGITVQAGTPAVEAELAEFSPRVRFRHPLVRSAAYRSASVPDRREIHRALAEVTDPQADPDRRAWHRAEAAPGPDEEVAGELERSAGRAQGRGGLAAAAAFMERAALLTPDPVRRTERLLTAARAKSDSGALDAALGLLVAVEADPLDARQAAELERLRGQIALDQRRGGDAGRLLLSAARRLERVDAEMSRAAYLDALVAAIWADDMGSADVRLAAAAARNAPPGPVPPRAIDVLLDAVALRATEGYAAAAPALTRALAMVVGLEAGSGDSDRWLRLAGGRIGQIIAMETWDFESWHHLAARQVEFARDTGALMHLAYALNYLARTHILAGELAAAARLVEEDHLIAEAAGNPPIADTAMMLAAWRGQEREAAELIEAVEREATARDAARLASLAAYASSVLNNGLGRSAAAYQVARRAFEREPLGYGSHIVPELAEAAARTGDLKLAETALEWLSERARATPTEWVLGIEARARALLAGGEPAEMFYRESIERLSRTRVRAQLARAHLLYGEWLRRERRRGEARQPLRTAHEMFDAMGIAAFAERAARELQATGEVARKRTVETTVELTAQEAQVARLARDGLSNPQIGARLFISARTVQYHLGKVFTKLDITSRSQLAQALPSDPDTLPAALTPGRTRASLASLHCPLADMTAALPRRQSQGRHPARRDRDHLAERIVPDAVPGDRRADGPVRAEHSYTEHSYTGQEPGAGGCPAAQPVAGKPDGLRAGLVAAGRAGPSGGHRPARVRSLPASRRAHVPPGDERVHHHRRRRLRARTPPPGRARHRHPGRAVRRLASSRLAAQPGRGQRRRRGPAPRRRAAGLDRVPRPGGLPPR